MEIVQQASLETGTRYTPSKPSKGMHEYCIAIETEETTPSRRVMDSILDHRTTAQREREYLFRPGDDNKRLVRTEDCRLPIADELIARYECRKALNPMDNDDPHREIDRNLNLEARAEVPVGQKRKRGKDLTDVVVEKKVGVGSDHMRYMAKEQLENCSVCLGHIGFEDNPIVYCEKCNLGVHAHCYGYPLSKAIPEGDWICQRCEFGAEQETCALCPMKFGIMKRTTDSKWAHLACALWVPEVFFRDGKGKEAVDTFQVAPRRWRHKCDFCKIPQGACMECSEEGCKSVFHLTCGLERGILLEYERQKNGRDIVVSFCEKHSMVWRRMNAKNRKGIIRARK